MGYIQSDQCTPGWRERERERTVRLRNAVTMPVYLCKSLQCTYVHNFVKTLRNYTNLFMSSFFLFRIKKMGFLITVIQSGIYFIIIVLFCKSIFLVVFFFFSFFLSIRLQTEPDKIFDVHFVMCGYKMCCNQLKKKIKSI